MVMKMAVYWPRGSIQAQMIPENAHKREESRRENSHEFVKDGSNYSKRINQTQDNRRDKGLLKIKENLTRRLVLLCTKRLPYADKKVKEYETGN